MATPRPIEPPVRCNKPTEINPLKAFEFYASTMIYEAVPSEKDTTC